MRTSKILTPRAGRRGLLALLLGALVLSLGLLAACGDDEGTGGPASGPVATAAGGGPTTLEIDLYPPYRPDVKVGRWTLTCAPAGGTLPNPQAACDALAANPSLLETPACTGEMITDQRSLRVTGTFDGRPVDYQRGSSAVGECAGDQESIGALLEALGNPVP